MSALRTPALSASPAGLRRSGMRWLRPSGTEVRAREAIATCYLRIHPADGSAVPFAEEQNDLQLVLASPAACRIEHRADAAGGYRDFVEVGEWRGDEPIGETSLPEPSELLSLILAGRRGFEIGEDRGGLLAGWHDKVRGFWGGSAGDRFGNVLSIGTCEQTTVFRGEDGAFLTWFERAPGPAQVISVADGTSVHSAAVLLQHLRRTPREAAAMADAVYAWMGEHMASPEAACFPAFQAGAAHGTLGGRWPKMQDMAFGFYLLAEAIGTCPILERSEVLTARGIAELPPPDVVTLTMGSEIAPHFRHRRTGWIVAVHGYRFGPYIGSCVSEWLRRDFEPINRTVDDVQRDLQQLATEMRARTGGSLVIQNLITTTAADRITNYSWLGEEFAGCMRVFANEANLMLTDLARSHGVAVVDSDALSAEIGVRHCPDRFHGSGEFVEAQRCEFHRTLRALGIPGF